MAQLSRRHVLALGAGRVQRRLAPGCGSVRRCPPMPMACRRSATSNIPPISITSTTSMLTRRKAALFSLIPSVRAYNQSYQTFNSLNAFILKGDGAQGMDMTFAPLMLRANDEPDGMYGLAAKSVNISADRLVYRFTMRPEAKFHDGTNSPRMTRRFR